MGNGLTASAIYTLTIAVWYHHSGYGDLYHGHEEASIAIAFTGLTVHGFDRVFIEQVNYCIGATQMPQKPDGPMQEVNCDADMAYLAQIDYLSTANRLRQE